MSRALRLEQLIIKMHFTVAVTNITCQKEAILILYIEILDYLVFDYFMIQNLVKIQIDQMTVRDL